MLWQREAISLKRSREREETGVKRKQGRDGNAKRNWPEMLWTRKCMIG